MSGADWPPDSARKGAFGHHPGCAPPRQAEQAPELAEWGCVPTCPALDEYVAAHGTLPDGDPV